MSIRPADVEVHVRRIGKRAVIRGALELLHHIRAARWAQSPGRGLIVTLHQVRPEVRRSFAPNAHLEITPDFLAIAIERARALGFSFVPLERVPDHLSCPAITAPFIAFTLDDGYRDNFEHAYPVFARYGVPFTVFPTAGFVERTATIWWKTLEALLAERDRPVFDFGNGPVTLDCTGRWRKHAAFDRICAWYARVDQDLANRTIDAAARAAGIEPLEIVEREIMSRAELAELASDRLVSIGAHTENHPNLKRLDPDRLRAEIVGGAERIGAITGYRPRSMAYPYGSRAAVGIREEGAAAEAGFTVAVTTQPGMLAAANLSRPFALPRVSLNGLYQDRRYVDVLLSGLPFAVGRWGRATPAAATPGQRAAPDQPASAR